MVEKLRPPRTQSQREIDAWRRDQNDDNSNRIPKVIGAEPGNVPTFTEDGGIEDNDIGVEDIQTYFDDGSIFYADNGFPAEDVSNFSYDDIQKLLSAINIFTDSLRLNTASPQDYLPGQISYDPVTKTNLSDTGISDVRVNIGQETQARMYNGTGSDWKNGQVATATTGFVGGMMNGVLADSLTLDSRRVGVVTAPIINGEWGLVTLFGEVRGINTLALGLGPVYLADTPGDYTTTKPLYPKARILVGYVTVVDEFEGIIFVYPFPLIRTNKTPSYSFTSNGIGAGTYYVGGYYDAPITDFTLTQAVQTLDLGTTSVAYGAHVFAVFGGPGTVDTGQVGLKVTGTSYQDDGTRTPLDSEVLTEDISTLLLNDYIETEKKWIGTVTYGLFLAEGIPTLYDVTFNYGFAKYEDLLNSDFTLIGFEVVGLAGANDTDFNIEVMHHKPSNWLYSAGAFIPGDGNIISFFDDFSPEDNIANNVPFAWKRWGLETFINGSNDEGIIVRITCGQNNSVQSMNSNVFAVLEGLPF